MRRRPLVAMMIGFFLVLGLALLQPQEQPQALQVSNPVPSVQPTPTPKPQRTPAPKASLPQVNGDRLFSHVEALGFIRDTESQRAKARTYIRDTLTQTGWKVSFQKFDSGINVVAERPGTNSKAGKILLTAHYDTVPESPGADDNASGVAVVLEMARLFAKRPTARSLQVALFDREEWGLLGSRAYAGSDRNIKDLKAVINLDMVGYACHERGCQTYPEGLPVKPNRDRGDFIAIVVNQENADLLDAFPPRQPGLPSALTLSVPFRGLLTPDLLRSDHAPFWYRGIGAIMFSDTANFRTPHYHQPSDRPATIDRPFFTGVAQIVANGLVTLLDPST